MARHTLYAYVDGSDLDEVVCLIESRLATWLEPIEWGAMTPRLVNQKSPPNTDSVHGDLPDWDLGLNMELPDPGFEPEGWFAHVEAVALAVHRVASETGRSFVVGIEDSARGIAEDLFGISSAVPDLAQLRRIIGA
jgi:hypothetical protein